MSPEHFVSCAKALQAKRKDKGYEDENGNHFILSQELPRTKWYSAILSWIMLHENIINTIFASCLSPHFQTGYLKIFYNGLIPCLFASSQMFFSNLESSTTVDKKLVDKARRFRQHLTKRFNWDFESEPEEFAPVVVET